ncbi:MAG: hypothetical protein HFH89_10750 [Lachnospiraceae bacterium]|nr:hypothetical protein [uncultured Acetatifactor sp.]MCI8288117.1 hypothetical protein [Lachnospiraceae bacterium]
MFVNEAMVKEVNQYYTRRGGKRAVNATNFANYMQKASFRNASASKAAEQPDTPQPAERTKESAQSQSGNGISCCEQCRLTSQLMVQMISRSLYSQSGLGYSPSAAGALSTYRNMMNLFGGNGSLS